MRFSFIFKWTLCEIGFIDFRKIHSLVFILKRVLKMIKKKLGEFFENVILIWLVYISVEKNYFRLENSFFSEKIVILQRSCSSMFNSFFFWRKKR